MALTVIRVPPKTPSTQTPRIQFDYCAGTLTLSFGKDSVELLDVDEETLDEIEARIGHLGMDAHIVNAERVEDQAALEAFDDNPDSHL